MAYLLRHEPGSRRRDVLLFGAGTIGTHVVREVLRGGAHHAGHVPIPWDDRDQRRTALRELRERVCSPVTRPPLSIVWAAGRAGFSATASDVDQEAGAFRDVVDLVHDLQARAPSVAPSLHLVSSAGGLFEGQVVRSTATSPAPQRPYGRLKRQQETIALDSLLQDTVTTYRPSSVYAPMGGGRRPGLIGVLVGNGIARRVTTIVGALHTLRDYVMAEDVGAHVGAEATRPGGSLPGVQMLVSGCPASIQEVIAGVEAVLRRPVYIRMAASWNARHIAFSPSVVAPRFEGRPVLEGIRRVHGEALGRPIS